MSGEQIAKWLTPTSKITSGCGQIRTYREKRGQKLLTDIFSFRYADKPIWTSFGRAEQRLLLQCFSIVKEMFPYYDDQGSVSPTAKAKWKEFHDRIAVELGVIQLSNTTFSYTTTWQGQQTSQVSSYSWEKVCENWLTATPKEPPDEHIKERLSLIEVAFRDRENLIETRNDAKQPSLSSTFRQHAKNTAWIKKVLEESERRFQSQVEELNTRFRQARCGLHYHNGFIQISQDSLVQAQVEEPFWKIVADPIWANVDHDMKDAIDRRDNGDRDPSWYACRALESTIKIISDQKEVTHGGEKGAHGYIDNLQKKRLRLIEPWEAEILKKLFSEIRNPFGHGPGSAEMPSLSPQQTDVAIEMCMAWIKSLIRRI